MAVPDVKEYGLWSSRAATAAGVIALMGLGTDDTEKCSGMRHSAASSPKKQWQSKTAWSNYAAKHLSLPYGSHENQLIRTDFFNTHPCYR